MMGCTDEQGCDCEDNEKPARKESVSDFYIGKYEVTQRLWRAVMDTDSILPFNGGCEDCPICSSRSAFASSLAYSHQSSILSCAILELL